MPPRKTTKNNRKSTTRTIRNSRTTRSTTTKRTTSPTNSTYSCKSPRYNTPRVECQARIGSYRNVYQQFTPSSGKTTFSPTAANKWTKYVNNGVLVYKYNNVQFGKFFGQKWTQATPTAARQYLRKKFGPGIKDVTRGKGNCWLVATTKNVTGRPFNTYDWK